MRPPVLGWFLEVSAQKPDDFRDGVEMNAAVKIQIDDVEQDGAYAGR
jgi:hypothetical protein